MSASTLRSPFWKSLYNRNPFYAISAVLMLYAVRAAYGELEIGAINCWMMMGVLAIYTLVLAVIGVLIVRLGKVWEDARSIFVLLLLLFLAVSVSADDLFVNMVSSGAGTALLVCGYLFSAVVSEAVLRGAGIRLSWRYRLPYHLLLALFYVAPWWCSPELHPHSRATVAWMLLLFPTVAAGMFLTLFAAVRRGPADVANNGTPWPWPSFPWTAFGVLAAAVVFRSFILCLTVGPSGFIWKELASGGRAIAFDSIWGTYFLVPLALAGLLLLLEAGIVARDQRILQNVMKLAPLLLLMSMPIGGSDEFSEFLHTVTTTIGSPIWITVGLQTAFYCWAWFRRVPGADKGALATCSLWSIVGPRTIDMDTLTEPSPWPMFVIGLALFVYGLRTLSSRIGALSAAVTTVGLWWLLPQTSLAGYRMTLCYHLLWLTIVLLGLFCKDSFADVLRAVGAVQMPVASLVVMTNGVSGEVPWSWRFGYVVLMAAICFAIARLWHSRWYLYAFTATLAIAGYGSTMLGFHRAVETVGRPAISAFAWSVGALLLAFLISAHKAHWLPPRLFPKWSNGNGSGPQLPDEPSAPPSHL